MGLKFVAAVAAESSGPHFVLATRRGQRVRSGSFADESPQSIRSMVDLVVIADYGLLDTPIITTLSASPSQLQLLAPQPEPNRLTADEVLGKWLEEDETVTVHPADFDLLNHYVLERRVTQQRLNQSRRAIEDRVRRASPGYAALLERDGSFDPRIFPILARFPTPRSLRSAGPIQLSRLLEQQRINDRRPLLDSLVALGAQETPALLDREMSRYVEVILPGLVNEYLLTQEQLSTIDQAIFRTAQASEAPDATADGSAARGTFPAPPAWASGDLDVSAHTNDLLGLARLLFTGLYESPCDSTAAYERYRAARATLSDHGLSTVEALELESIGQHLAVAAGDLTGASRHRATVKRLCEPMGDSVPARLRADLALISALTEFETIDATVGATQLRAALDSDLIRHASPPLASEARGVVAMILALLGDRQRALDELELTYQEIDAHQAAGAARAAADTGRMLLVGGTVGDGNAGFDAVAARAAFHSQGTAYRSYFNYVTMLTSYLTGDVERAVCAFAEIQQLGRWAHHNLRFDRMSRHSYAVVLSGRGQFGAARAELSRLTESRGDTVAGAELIIHLMLTHRLNLAMGQLEEVLDDTSPTGPLSSQHVQRANPRFVPGVLLIRGSALARQGMEQSAADHFLRATRQAVIADEFLSLAAVETAEYRHWLAGLNRRALPPGIPLDVYEALLRRPILIAQSLPTLTRQQTRILQRLATGRSTASIAVEMGISRNTLKTHLRMLYRRLGAGSRKQALILAEEYGLLR